MAVVTLLAVVAMTNESTSGQLTGIVIGLDGDLTTVDSFDVLSNGDQIRLVPSTDGDFTFPLGHLRDHLRTGEPIDVEYQLIDGVLMAVRISDAD